MASKTEAQKSVKAQAKPSKLKLKGELNLNLATAKQISKSFKGFGPKRAQAIVAYRDQNGAFKKFEDLAKVRGISKNFVKKHLERLNATFKLNAVPKA